MPDVTASSDRTNQQSVSTELTDRILDGLDREPATRPADVDEQAWNYAVQYTKGRYRIGLEHYRRLFRDLDWARRRHGLDIGSGAGHWAIAFALDNREATGIDRSAAFVRLANGAAAAAGLSERVRHGRSFAETLDFPDSHFDAVWCHSVLMYCDIEATLGEVARVLEPGGQFYCGYSSTGFRLGAIYNAVARRQSVALLSQLGNFLGATLKRDGMARPPWSTIGCATADELAAVCRVFGLDLLRRPGLPDGPAEFAGIPAAIDLVCARAAKPQLRRAELLDLPATSEAGRQRHRELVRLGLGKLVHDVLTARGEDLRNADIRSLYVWAGVRAGRAEAVAALADDGLDPRVRGLLAFDRRRMSEAVAAFADLPPDDPDRSFLLGTTLLWAGDTNAATREFAAGAEMGHRPLECEFAGMLARIDVANWQEQRHRMLRALQLLPKTLGGCCEQGERLAASLSDLDQGSSGIG